jgi:O-antigen/teichoic acid export membrane protein
MAVARKIAYNVVFNVVAKVCSTILALVGIGFITRYLGKEGFGDYATVLAFFSFFGSIADLGLYAITAREISRKGANEQFIMSNVFSLRIIVSVFVFLMTPLLVLFLPYSHDVKLGIVLVAGAFVFSSTYMVLNGVFQKNLAMDRVALAEIAGKIIQLSIIVLAVRMNLGFTAIIASILASMVVNFTLVLIFARKYIGLGLSFDFSYWKKFLRESLPLGISVIVTFAYFKLDTILLSVLKTNTEVGIYNAAYKVIENLTFFPSMIIGLMLPIMSRSIFTDKNEFERISNETFKVFFMLVIPLATGALFLSENIISLIGGSGFSESAGVLRILIFALVFIFFGNFFNNILIAASLQKKLMYSLAGCAAFNITANFILIPRFSYNGAAISSVATEFLVVVVTFFLTAKYVRYVPKINHGPGILMSGLGMALFLFFFNSLSFFILVPGGAIIYGLLLWLTKTITPMEILSIVSKKQGPPPLNYE